VKVRFLPACRGLLVTVAASVLAIPAFAGPLVTPLSDVDIVYAVPMPDGGLGGQRMRWSVRGWLQRVDLDGSATYMITDYRIGRLSVIDGLHHTRSDLGAPGGPLLPPGTAADDGYSPLGADSVAGVGCRWWNATDSDGQHGSFCYSEDGLLLEARRDGHVLVRAVSVSREVQPESLFVPPADYRNVAAAHP
jgi:hypothetical protein